MRRLILAIASALLLSCGLAHAADIPVKARPLPPPVPVFSWTGFYIGGHVGAGWARKEWHDPAPRCDFINFEGFCTAPSNLDLHQANGPLGGGQVGINWQVAPYVVIGIEGQYSWANLKGSHEVSFSQSTSFGSGQNVIQAIGTESTRFSSRIEGIATIAGRIGITGVPSDRTLFYVKGGAAYVKEDFAETINTASSFLEFAPVNGGFIVATGGERTTIRDHSASASRWGWMAGAGVEFGLFDNWSAKVEYNYLGFGTKTVTMVGTACDFDAEAPTSCSSSSRDRQIRQDIQLIKFGLNYRFDWGKGPVGVRAAY
jgi:outer membrane immunogenic protein